MNNHKLNGKFNLILHIAFKIIEKAAKLFNKDNKIFMENGIVINGRNNNYYFFMAINTIYSF